MSTEQGPAADAKQAARELLDRNATGERIASRDARQVKSRLTDLAGRGDTDAQNLLGAIELEVEQKPKNARHWFELAAAKGDPVGQRSLGHLYANGLGVKSDLMKAVDLFRAASAAGDSFAMYNLAAANLRAQGAYCSFDETLSLLATAAELGLVESAAKLGDVLAGVGRNSEAIEWYVKAASRGHVGAMNVAASWFRDGTAGEVDLVQAVRWFLSMLNYGNGDGVHEAIQAAKNMSVEEIREAARLAGRVGDGEAIITALSR